MDNPINFNAANTWFKDQLKGVTIDFDASFPNYILYRKEAKSFIEYDRINKNIWCEKKILDVLANKYLLDVEVSVTMMAEIMGLEIQKNTLFHKCIF